MNELQKQKSWASIEFETAAEHEDLASWVMVHVAGAVGCEIKPMENGAICINATFEKEHLDESDIAKIGGALEEYGLAASVGTLRTREIVQEDWLAKWKQGFKPFVVGNKLLVCPPWERVPATESGRSVLIIEPAMAFGTGLHATTQFCLRMVETLPLGSSLLDVGTGSGILALAALLADPHRSVVGIDTDPVAIESAHKNAELNGLSHRLKLLTGSTEKVTDQFDDLLSNLTCEDIVALLPEYRRLTKAGGRVICAGVLGEKRAMLEKSCQTNGFVIESAEESPPWCGLVLKYQPH